MNFEAKVPQINLGLPNENQSNVFMMSGLPVNPLNALECRQEIGNGNVAVSNTACDGNGDIFDGSNVFIFNAGDIPLSTYEIGKLRAIDKNFPGSGGNTKYETVDGIETFQFIKDGANLVATDVNGQEWRVPFGEISGNQPDENSETANVAETASQAIETTSKAIVDNSAIVSEQVQETIQNNIDKSGIKINSLEEAKAKAELAFKESVNNFIGPMIPVVFFGSLAYGFLRKKYNELTKKYKEANRPRDLVTFGPVDNRGEFVVDPEAENKYVAERREAKRKAKWMAENPNIPYFPGLPYAEDFPENPFLIPENPQERRSKEAIQKFKKESDVKIKKRDYEEMRPYEEQRALIDAIETNQQALVRIGRETDRKILKAKESRHPFE